MTPPAARRCGASRTSSTCGSIRARCPTGRCTIRSRTRVVRHAFPRRLHRRVHRADPWMVLHHARPGHRAVRPPGIQNLCGARHCAGQRRAEDEQVAAELPRRHRGVRPRRLRRDALVPDGIADPARRQPGGHRAGHPRRCPAGPAAACGTPTRSCRCTRRRRAPGGPTRRTCWTATSWPSSQCCATISPIHWMSAISRGPATSCASSPMR